VELVAKWKIHKRFSIPDAIWWRWMPGSIIQLPWPSGEIRVRQEPSGIWDYIRSSDPNDFYREWLEINVGRQGWHWQWRLGTDNVIEIKFRRDREKWAMLAMLMFT
jgi:hypothetical protein